ncbi:MAG: undecaprenyl/decaprenyl-phosphate alpha-N-acetylglucosaminyl 1-phosphate transferase [Bacteroidales bacterium]|nr:undecaprenyl/decaprenyl-phosphate alpha-N-acetylglucosaminyl 1-phosphate transferase [Bacteroidales bacterium]
MSSYWSYILLAFIIGVIATAVTIPLIIAFCRKFGYYDQPNQRKVHKQAIPRLGGMAFLPSLALSFAVTMLVYYSRTMSYADFHYTAALMIVGAAIIFVVGGMDDLMDLPANVKFVILTVGSLALPACNLTIDNLHGFFGLYAVPLWVAYPLTVLVILTIVNAINLIDGIDGLASGISAICLGVFVYLYADLRNIVFVVMAAGLLGSVLAFMCFNLFGKVGRMKIFMGDAGSLILGYVLAYLAIKYMMVTEQDIYTDINPILIPYSLFIVPVFDLVRVAFTRLASGEPMFHADQRHIHHIMMRCGLTMHQALVAILGLAVFFMAANLVLDDMHVPITIIFFLDIAIYLLFFVVAFVLIDRKESLREMMDSEVLPS